MTNILIIKHGALGDVIRTSYFVKPLYEQYDTPDIYWLTSRCSLPLLRFNPYIFDITSDYETIKNIHFDWIISLDDEIEVLEKLKNLTYEKITGAFLKLNERVYSEDSSLWFDMGLISIFGKQKADELKKSNKLNHTEIFSSILKIKNVTPLFFSSELIYLKTFKFKPENYFVIGLNSGAGGRWESKKLKIEESVKLINLLKQIKISNKDVFIYLLGGNEDLGRNNDILNLLPDKDRVELFDSANSLLLFAAIIRTCDFVITSDSLALHLSISQRVPNLSFYAPSSAVEIDTFGTGVKVISTSIDYCNYSSECNNSSITAERIFETFYHHANSLFSNYT